MHDDWAVLGNIDITALFPLTDLTVELTWDTAGLRGTGSHTVIAENVFVPEYRTIPFSAMTATNSDAETPTAFRMAPITMSALIVASAVVGLGDTACKLVTDRSHTKFVPMTEYRQQSDSQAFQSRLGESLMRIKAAKLHLAEVARVVDEAAEAAQPLDKGDIPRLHGSIGHAVHLVTMALDDLMYAGGASVFAMSNPLQQVWRDANVGARHAITNAHVNYEVAGGGAVGVVPFVARV
jgi:3-hydroxy-9,10-secoandrosta-1,3,5(10)-triene-9,17-dione monooxygenase